MRKTSSSPIDDMDDKRQGTVQSWITVPLSSRFLDVGKSRCGSNSAITGIA